MKGRETIPVFFSTDDRYAPYLAVAIASLAKNASKEFDYRLHVLNCGLAKRNRNRLLALAGGNIALEFADVRDYLIRMGGRLHLRDYYTAATYYRFFIPDLFPAYEKGIYLDCDVAINGDIAELYGTDLGENLLGAVTEEVMTDIPTYGRYARTVLGLRPSEYFNAGVLLMNLGKMRRTGLLDRFSALLDRRRFPVAQDQDYLNLLAAGSVTYLDAGWNRTPFPYAPSEEPKLAHYKMNFKPWHYRGVSYEDCFWRYAEATPYYRELLAEREAYSAFDAARDDLQNARLLRLAEEETEKAETLAAEEYRPAVYA
ncbi:MAG: glycosyltransferase family 8 protein [Clostridia bacterium]|nr:glycosyltransferase family 8 protein [Clostridia bacterium]